MKRKLCFLFALPLMFAACENVLPVEEVDLSSMVAEFTTPATTITFDGHVVGLVDNNRYISLSQGDVNRI